MLLNERRWYGNGDTEREFGNGIRAGSEAVVVPIEVREVEDERLERLERESSGRKSS